MAEADKLAAAVARLAAGVPGLAGLLSLAGVGDAAAAAAAAGGGGRATREFDTHPPFMRALHGPRSMF